MPPKRKINNINRAYMDDDDCDTPTTSNPTLIDKKIKLEDSNKNNNTTPILESTNDNNIYEINILNKKTKNELIKIANSMGIISLVGNKSDIISKIIKSVESYKSSNRVQNKQQTSLINRFGVSVYDLPIKTIDRLESSFWKIFRNKWLFQYISKYLKNYDNQFDSFGYNYFINVRKMVLSKNDCKMELLRDKVITNRSLVFDSVLIHSKEYLISLFKWFREDNLFYQSLFKNYFKQIGTTINTIAGYIIDSNSMLALQILIEKYNYQPTVKSTLYHAIKSRCSIGTLVFIINKIGRSKVERELNESLDEFCEKCLLNDNTILQSSRYTDDTANIDYIKKITEWTWGSSHWSVPTDPIDKLFIHRFKLINYLICEKLISTLSESNKSKIRESFQIGSIEKQFKLKDLINSCKTIIILNLKCRDGSNCIFSTLEEINSIESQFTKNELNSKLLKLFDRADDGLLYRNNQDIKKLFEFYLQCTDNKNMIYYYLIYGATIEQYEKIPTSLFYYQFNYRCPELNYLYYSLKVCSVEFLSVYLSKRIDSNAMVVPSIKNILFSQVNNIQWQPFGIEKTNPTTITTTTTKQRKIKFITLYYEHYKEQSNSKDHGMFGMALNKYAYPLFYIFCLIIESDDIELLQEFHTMTNGDFTFFTGCFLGYSYYYRYQFNALHYCKSPDMAEFLFNNYRYYLFEPVFCPYQQQNVVFLDFSWYFKGSIEILKRIESLVDPKDYPKYLPSIHPKNQYDTVAFNIVPAITPSTITKTMRHMIDNPMIYQALKEQDLYHICSIANDEKCIEDIKYIIENTTLKYNIFDLFPQQNTYQDSKKYDNFKYKRQLLDWVYEKRKGDLKNGRFAYRDGCDIRKSSKQISSLYLTNRIDQLFSDTSTINSAINKMGTSFNYSDAALIDLMALAIGKNGDINTLERILKLDPNDTLMKLKKSFIYTVLYKSIQVGRIEILDYLFENYKQLLVLNSKKVTSGLFDQKEFKSLVALAIGCDHLPIVEFFFEILAFKLPLPQLSKIFKNSTKDIVYNIYNSKLNGTLIK